MTLVLPLRDAVRCWLWQRRLERPLVPSDPNPKRLFLLAFAVYWVIGECISEFHGHAEFDWFFNSDVPRVVSDMIETPSRPGSVTAAAHPLFVMISLIAAPLARLLGRSGLLAALALSHAATALSVSIFYAILRKLAIARWFALAAALVFLLSTSNLVFGSIPETFSFVPCVLMLSLWVALASTSPLPNAACGVFSLALNIALLPHALFAAIAVWSQRSTFGQFLLRAARYWACFLALAAAAFYLQHRVYPEMNPLDTHMRAGYESYSEIPKTAHAISRRGRRLLAHMVAFDVVAPKPFLRQPRKITTFMWEENESMPAYSLLGKAVIAAWLVAFAFATYSNVRRLLDVRPDVRATIILCGGWLFGVSLFFLCFGDDLLLFSECWMAHMVLWVAVGLGAERNWNPARRVWPVLISLFVLSLALNNAEFVRAMLRHYQTSDLITL